MGRNYSLTNQIAEAAGCYIEADRLQIDDPIYRGRVNSCMGYICAQNNDNDSLALIFYKRANEHFQESSDKWYYAQTLLDRSEFNIYLHNYDVADSLLRIARSYQVDSAYRARYYETRGLYFYEKQEYDSALICFGQSLDYWQDEEAKCFSYLKIMQSYYFGAKDINNAIPYARLLVKHSVNPNYLSNAYYCLMQDAKEKDNTQLLSKYSHARTDALKLLRDNTNKYAEAIPKLMEYLQDPHPWRWVCIIFAIVAILVLLLGIGLWHYRKHSNSAHEQLDILSTYIRTQEEDLIYQQSLLEFEQNRLNILEKYHTPHKRWKNYLLLKRDLDPWMHEWLQVLDTLSLSEQEKIFCAISLVYPHMTDVEIADFICYSKAGIRVFKNRIFKKLGVTSLDFADFLRNLSISR
jgi:tetratricopeptide (TPR) repeat protein